MTVLLRQPSAKPDGAGRRSSVTAASCSDFAPASSCCRPSATATGSTTSTGPSTCVARAAWPGASPRSACTHAGDRLDADFDLGRDKTIRLALQAREAEGGALAGALGLAADQPFLVDATASGTTSQGRFQVTSRSGAIDADRGRRAPGRRRAARRRARSPWRRRAADRLPAHAGPAGAVPDQRRAGGRWAVGARPSRPPPTTSTSSRAARPTSVGRSIGPEGSGGRHGRAAGSTASSAGRRWAARAWPGPSPASLDHGLVAGDRSRCARRPGATGWRRPAVRPKLGWGGPAMLHDDGAGLAGRRGRRRRRARSRRCWAAGRTSRPRWSGCRTGAC